MPPAAIRSSLPGVAVCSSGYRVHSVARWKPRRVGHGSLLLTLVAATLLLVISTGARADSGAVSRAVHFLAATQLKRDLDLSLGDIRIRDYAGGWPQYFRLLGAEPLRTRDVSPFTVAFIHHALTLVVPENREILGLSVLDLLRARVMRRRAIAFLRRFQSSPHAADAGTFGFWPYDAHPGVPGPALTVLLTAWLRGPILGGNRVPLNLSIFPDTLAIPTDADVTATTYAALQDDARLDGGPGSSVAFWRFFTDWRDLGVVPRRADPSWPPPASGAFLTWLAYRAVGQGWFANDVDLVVNANVLYALGRSGQGTIPGVAQAVSLINEATSLGLHRDRLPEITDYYPDNLVYHYAVSRAFREGGIHGLEPAVELLASDLELEAISRADGTVFWDRGAPQLNTAFALLTLVNAGRETPLMAGAAAYLEAQQAVSGAYDEATFFIARNDGGQIFEFFSRAFTTALVMEALARFALYRRGAG